MVLLHYAVENETADADIAYCIHHMIISYQLNIHTIDRDGFTLLLRAARICYIQVMQILLLHGARDMDDVSTL
jgi:ankyrin repeat protein